jgi:hypothetical protein
VWVAYLDPGIGSILFQALMGTLLGAMLTLKFWWQSVKAFVTRRPGKTREAAEGATEDGDSTDANRAARH